MGSRVRGLEGKNACILYFDIYDVLSPSPGRKDQECKKDVPGFQTSREDNCPHFSRKVKTFCSH
jgi:hypothetical protein